MERSILHIDMNCFYASVECMLNPELKAYPVAVGGDAEERHGIILTKNYVAKNFGVKTGEALWQAKQKCPRLIIIPPHYDQYMKYSRLARDIYGRYADLLEPFGMDEVWADVTESAHLYGGAEKIAEDIRQTVKTELGLTVSIGVSFNKVFAKLGSDMKKPDAITEIPRDSFKEMIWDLPASGMLGVGYATAKKLSAIGIHTIGELARWPADYMARRFGKCGVQIWRFANGLDSSPVEDKNYEMLDKSCGHGITTIQDLKNASEVWNIILELCQDIGHRLRDGNKKATGIAISVRDCALYTKQWQCGISAPTSSPSVMAREAFALFQKSYTWERPIRSITVRAINLTSADASFQIDMFTDAERLAKSEALDKAIDNLRMRFGKRIVRNACLLNNPKMPEYEPTVMMPNGISC